MTVPNLVVFFKKFNGNFKNVVKKIISSLQLGFTDNFVPNCLFQLYLWQFKL